MAYEDLAEDMDGECNRVLDLLGVRRRKLETKMLRQRTRSLAETVTNYSAMKDRFQGTEWEAFFAD
jgi:hypothetical protein